MVKDKKGKEAEKAPEGNLPKYMSEKVKVHVVPRYVSQGTVLYDFSISGRPPAPLSKGQGDHVTAFALIERGIRRHLINLEISRPEDLEKIRRLRENVNKYIFNVLAINHDFRKSFIDEVLHWPQQSYDTQRIHKTQIKQNKKTVASLVHNTEETGTFLKTFSDSLKTLALDPVMRDQFMQLESLKRLRENFQEIDQSEVMDLQSTVEKGYVYNARLMCDEICDIIRAFLTKYNKIPGVAFPKVKSHPAPDSEGIEVRTALDNLDAMMVQSGITTREMKRLLDKKDKLDRLGTEYDEDSRKLLESLCEGKKVRRNTYLIILKEEKDGITEAILREKERIPDVIAFNLVKLFFYPYVLEDDLKANEKTPGYRDNNIDTFYTYMARHLYIVFSAYPELEELKDQIVDKFIRTYLQQGKEWKSVIIPTDINGIVTIIKEGIEKIKSNAIEDILDSKYIQGLSSSENSDVDEDALHDESSSSSGSAASGIVASFNKMNPQ